MVLKIKNETGANVRSLKKIGARRSFEQRAPGFDIVWKFISNLIG
jgi:hypothetical protein